MGGIVGQQHQQIKRASRCSVSGHASKFHGRHHVVGDAGGRLVDEEECMLHWIQVAVVSLQTAFDSFGPEFAVGP